MIPSASTIGVNTHQPYIHTNHNVAVSTLIPTTYCNEKRPGVYPYDKKNNDDIPKSSRKNHIQNAWLWLIKSLETNQGMNKQNI